MRDTFALSNVLTASREPISKGDSGVTGPHFFRLQTMSISLHSRLVAAMPRYPSDLLKAFDLDDIVQRRRSGRGSGGGRQGAQGLVVRTYRGILEGSEDDDPGKTAFRSSPRLRFWPVFLSEAPVQCVNFALRLWDRTHDCRVSLSVFGDKRRH